GQPAHGKVRLATVHASKGLEFRAVYVPGCELGLFPLTSRKHRPVLDEAGDYLDADEDSDGSAGAEAVANPAAAAADPEERRVFYVAVTRAKEELTLSYCTFRRDGRTQPSPFLRDIGRGLLRRAKLGTDEAPAPRRPPRRQQ